MNWLEQLGWPYAKPASELDDIDEADISFASLNPTYVVAMQVCQLGQLLLGEVAIKPDLANMPSENYARV